MNLRPTPTSQTFVARQGDSYAAYQLSSSAPFRMLQSTPNFGAQLTGCLPKQSALAPVAVPRLADSIGVPSQPSVVAPTASGGYLWIQPTAIGTSFNAVLFDTNMHFVSTTSYGYRAYQFTLTDVNGDGLPDLVILIGGGETTNAAIGVMLGNGGTSFQPPVTRELPNSNVYSPVSYTYSIADVNGDGKPDLILSATGPLADFDGISFLEGNGDGTFQDPVSIAAGVMATALALTDLNADGKPDLISLTNTTAFPPSLSVQLGMGNGSFSPPRNYPISGTGSASIAIGDMNGDGIPDIVAGGLTILFGDGKGGFPRRADYLSDAVQGILLTDLDGDGRIDIVAGVTGTPSIFLPSPGNTGPTSVYFGRGNGTFWSAPATSVPGAATVDNFGLAVTAADFDGDGTPDVAYSDFHRISILRGSSTGFFTMTYQYQLASPLLGLPVWLAAADFNGDGKADLAAAVQSPTGVTNYVAMLLGNGDGTMTGPISTALPAGVSASSLVAGDFNGDGILDLAVVVNTQNGGVADEAIIYLGNGDGTFRQGASYGAGPVAFGIVAADFNNDGKLDLAITNEGMYPKANGSVSILLGKGDGTFAAAPSIASAGGAGIGAYSIAAADFNGDGKQDLAVTLSNDTTYGGGVAVLLGRGDGTFQPLVVYPASSAQVTVGDFNGDGIADLIVSIPRSEDAYGGLGYLLGNGDGTFQPAVSFGGTVGPVVAMDLNRDGKLDLTGADGQFGVGTYLNVSQPQPPVAVVSAATFAPGPIAPDSLASAFGKNITGISFAGPPGASLPAQIIYSSPEQMNFLVPAGAALGAVTASVMTAGRTYPAPVQITATAPGLFSLNSSGLAAAYAVRVSADGTQTVELPYTVQNGGFAAAPLDLGTAGDTVYLSLFGTGIRGAGDAVTVSIQGVNAPVAYAGPQGGFAGLDQVNVVVPQTLAGSGTVSVAVTGGGVVSNQVTVTIH